MKNGIGVFEQDKRDIEQCVQLGYVLGIKSPIMIKTSGTLQKEPTFGIETFSYLQENTTKKRKAFSASCSKI